MQFAETVMQCVWRASWQASVLALLILLLRWVMGRRLSPQWRGRLWMLVLLRLALPVLPSSPWSLFCLVPAAPPPIPVEIQWPVETIIVHISANTPMYSIPQKLIHWPTILAESWLAGATGCALWTVFVNLRFARRIRRSTEPPTNAIALLSDLARQMRVRRLPRAVMSDAVATPALFGLFRPQLLLPIDLFQRLTDEEARFVLLHELAHVRRRDLAVGWISCILRIVHWFNPLIWISCACQRADAESACDEMVLSASQADHRREYGYTLLKLAARFSPAIPASAVGMIDGKTQLRQRLLQIAGFRHPTVRWSIVGALLLVILAWLGLTDAHRLVAQPATNTALDTLVSRRYEVQDLVFAMGIHDDGNLPEVAGSTSPEKKELPADPIYRASKLIAMIRQAVPDEAWTSTIDADHFKTVGITITALPSTQTEIEEFIDRMRADTTVQVSVETRLLFLDPNKVRKLSFTLPNQGHGEAPKPVFVSDAQVNELIRWVQAEQSSSITAPRLTLFNHQKANILVSTVQAYVADVITSTNSKGEVSYDPQVKTVPTLSLQVEVRPAVSGDHLTTALETHLKFSRLVRMDEQKNYRGQKNVTIQIPKEFALDLSADTSVKNGQTALLACGMDKDSNEVLFIAIKPTVIKK
jgi:beta-lactamase regulating signal transducer with metallopeptidase domain